MGTSRARIYRACASDQAKAITLARALEDLVGDLSGSDLPRLRIRSTKGLAQRPGQRGVQALKYRACAADRQPDGVPGQMIRTVENCCPGNGGTHCCADPPSTRAGGQDDGSTQTPSNYLTMPLDIPNSQGDAPGGCPGDPPGETLIPDVDTQIWVPKKGNP